MNFKLFALASAMATTLVAAPAMASTAFDLDTPLGFRNGSWSFGEIFTVGASNITVNALGAYDDGGDGFVTSGGIEVGIFRESDDALLASTSVLSSDALSDHFRFRSISALTLLANTAYRVVAVNQNDLYNIDTNYTVHPAITRSGYGYCNTTVLTSCDTHSNSERVWMANFQFDGGGGGGVPEPATWALMIGGFGLAGASLRRRKAVAA